MAELKYQQQMMQMGGVIVKIEDGAVSMDLKGRLGFMKIPMRMLVTDYELKIGQEVLFTMTFPEVISPEPNMKYVSNLEKKKEEETK